MGLKSIIIYRLIKGVGTIQQNNASAIKAICQVRMLIITYKQEQYY